VNKAYRSKQYRKKIEEDKDVSITHTSYVLYFHLVWSAKKKFRLITDSVMEDLELLLRKKSEELGVHLLAVGINADHVHNIISLKPTHYIPEVVKELKGFSSHEINKKQDDFIKWARGYDIRTVSQRNLQAAISYVKNQKRHHAEERDMRGGTEQNLT
jgi:putative transposase